MITLQPFFQATMAPAAFAAQMPTAADPAGWTEIVSAIALAIIALALLGAGVAAILLLRDVRKLTRTVDKSVTQLTPQTERLLHQAERVAEDAGDVTTSVRSSMNRVRDTMETADDRARAALDSAEARIRRFGEVVGVLQAEIEEALLDAASTARGLQATANIFRRLGGRGRGGDRRDSGESAGRGSGELAGRDSGRSGASTPSERAALNRGIHGETDAPDSVERGRREKSDTGD